MAQKEAELKLQNNAQYFHQIIEGTEIGTWKWNIQTGETFFNEKWANVLGYELQELEPTSIATWSRFADTETQKEFEELLQNHFDGKTAQYEFESKMRHKDGRWLWVHDKGKVISWTLDSKPEWMIGYHQDIDDRKKNELLLERYKDLLERCNETARIGTWDMDLKEQALSWSKVTLEIHEVEPEFVPNVETGIEFYKEGESRDTITGLFGNCVEHGESFDVELEIITANRNSKWVRAIGIPEMKNDVCVHVYGLFQDIDKEKRAIEKLEFEEEQFRKTFEYATIGMALVGLDGKWIKVNKSLCDMIGYSTKSFLQSSFQDITHPDDLNTDMDLLGEMLSDKRDSYQMEKRYIHKSGTIVWVLLSVSLVKNDKGEALHFVSQINNITSRKEAEENSKQLLLVTQKQNERLLNFAHIVSHNLRSHTGNLTMLLELMKDVDPVTCKTDFFPLVSSASDNLSTTVQHLNEVATINTNEKEIEIELLPLHEFIEKAISNVKAQALEVKAVIKNNASKNCYVKSIPAYLDSILLNFLTNGIKYRSKDRPVKIEFNCAQQGNFTVVYIKDNGLGIDLKQNGDKLFGMYKTFHDHEHSKGIGLFITKNQIESLGGKVEVESEVNRGTTFKIYFRNEEI